jgi:hypothetical protein
MRDGDAGAQMTCLVQAAGVARHPAKPSGVDLVEELV